MAAIPPLVLVDGQPESRVSALDRGLSYGDGVFRTVAIVAGKPRWWPDHLIKLGHDGARLNLACPPAADWDLDLAKLGPLPASGVLRLTVTRGVGPRGYPPTPGLPGTRILACWTAELPRYPVSGLNLRVCDLRAASQPALAGIKHLNRLENVLARAEWADPDIHEGVMLDQDGLVVGGVMSNLFLWRDQRLVTPRLDRCGVAGLTRQRLLERARAAGLPVEEGDFGLTALLEAEEVFLSNSLMGLCRAHRLGNHVWPEDSVLPRLTALLHA